MGSQKVGHDLVTEQQQIFACVCVGGGEPDPITVHSRTKPNDSSYLKYYLPSYII